VETEAWLPVPKVNSPELLASKLRRQADQLLLLAARSGDLQLVLKQAEALYKQSEGRDSFLWAKG
jgi:hypothetical protein